jgi:hypothetical protein
MVLPLRIKRWPLRRRGRWQEQEQQQQAALGRRWRKGRRCC